MRRHSKLQISQTGKWEEQGMQGFDAPSGFQSGPMGLGVEGLIYVLINCATSSMIGSYCCTIV